MFGSYLPRSILPISKQPVLAYICARTGCFFKRLGRQRVPADDGLEYAERVPKITGTTFGKQLTFPGSLEPALFMKKVEHVSANECDYPPYNKIAVLPFELWHEFKIHTVNT